MPFIPLQGKALYFVLHCNLKLRTHNHRHFSLYQSITDYIYMLLSSILMSGGYQCVPWPIGTLNYKCPQVANLGAVTHLMTIGITKCQLFSCSRN